MSQPSDAESPVAPGIANIGSKDDSAAFGGAGTATDLGMAENQLGLLGSSAQRDSSGRVGLAAVVIDDESPLVHVFQELGLLERVCDADWVRFEPVANCGSGRSPPMLVDGGYGEGRVGGGPRVVPLAALVMQP